MHLEDTTIPLGLCQCGCGAKTAIAPTNSPRYGSVRGKPYRFAHGHHFRIPVADYFDPAKGYFAVIPSGCWQWKKAISRDGYARMNVGGKTTPAHRPFYKRFRGPIPDGMQIDHLCRNRSCVNPAHMELVTNTQNLRRGNATKLSPAQVIEIRGLAGTMSQQAIADRYGVCQVHISAILRRKLWADI